MREPCAVCDETNAHSRLCRDCARDPANADWVIGDEETGDKRDVAEMDRVAVPLAVALDRRLRALTPLGRQICALLMAKDQQVYRDPRRHALVIRRVQARKKYRAIARQVGCSDAYVRRIVARICDF